MNYIDNFTLLLVHNLNIRLNGISILLLINIYYKLNLKEANTFFHDAALQQFPSQVPLHHIKTTVFTQFPPS